jgi:hypothetical protein
MLYIKKEKVLNKKAVKGNQGAAKNSAANSGPIYREIRPVKLDFSATNFKAKVTGWRLSIEKKADTLFPAVCDCARGIAGISAASTTAVDSEYHDPQILARANLESEDEEDENENDNTQATNKTINGSNHDNGSDDEHHDDSNNSGVEEDHDNHDGIGTKEDDEDDGNSGADEDEAVSDDGENYSNHYGETEENYAEGSDLTEISSSSDVQFVEAVIASGSCGKGVQRGRH